MKHTSFKSIQSKLNKQFATSNLGAKSLMNMIRRPGYQKYGERWLQRALVRFGSWDAVARTYGLKSKAAAWNMAHGRQPIPRALFERMSGVDLIRKIAVPFLAARDHD